MVVEAGPTMVDSNVKSIFLRQDSKIEKNNLNLVLGADDLLKIRKKVCELYMDKKVIVAPCLTKLYISREQQVIDCDGKTTPDWFYFGTGAIAIIYDSSSEGLKIALFEERSIRLLWCMNWAHYVTVQTQTNNFHILNTKEDFSQHVGFLYENKDVADLMLNTINLITSGLSQGKSCSQCEALKSKSKKKLSTTSKSLDEDDDNEMSTKFAKRRSSLRESLLRRAIRQKSVSPDSERKAKIKQRSCTVIGTHSSSQYIKSEITKENPSINSEHSDEKSVDKTTTQRKITALTRANSFRKAVVHNSSIEKDKISKTQNNNNNNNNENEVEHDTKRLSRNILRKHSRENTTEKDSVMKTIFRKRRISRSQSLKILSRKRDSQISQISQTEPTVVDEKQQQQQTQTAQNKLDQKQYQRAKKLVKPRSSTDSLLLRGEAIQNIIETGHVARYARQKRQIAKRLEQVDMQSTDLCVTEL